MNDPSYSTAWRIFANAAMYLIMRTTMQLDLQGLENVPRTGPLLIIINHNSFLDPLVPCVFVRDDVFPMAKSQALNHWLGWVLKWYGAFPVRRGEADPSALKRSLRVLQAGHTLLMAPEGTRNPNGVLQEGHEGAALIAERSGAPILPVAMRGGAPWLSNLKRLGLRSTKIKMRVGKPLVVRPLPKHPTREELRVITDEMMYSLAALLPPEMHGRYKDAAQFAPKYLLPYHAPGTNARQSKQEVVPITN